VNADDFNWRLACVCIEDQHEFWYRKDVKMRAILRKDIHYAAVDGVHLMNVSMSLSIGLHDHPYYHVCPDILSLVRDPLLGNGCGSPNHT